MPIVAPTLFWDLMSSKKFKALLALVVLWTKAVHESIGLDPEALKWLTAAFAVYFVSQAITDFSENIIKTAAVFKGVPAPKEEKEIEKPVA